MIGAVLIVVAMLAMIPAFLIGGGALMALAGELFTRDAARRHKGSELIDTNV